MPQATGRADATRAVVFSPLDGSGRAELVEQRLTDAIVAGVLRDGERLPSESELARSLGVAVVTAREALVALRDKGLVRTRRGRDGGSFVTHDRDAAARMIDDRVRSLSRIELRDLSLHYAAIAGMAAEIAADRASEDDLTSLVEIDARADPRPPAAPAARSGASSSRSRPSASPHGSCTRSCACRRRPGPCSGCASGSRIHVIAVARLDSR
jgi:DNA-binding transcriptional regulator YhcF (GntR family)